MAGVIILIIVLLIIVAFMLWKMWCLKKEIYRFADTLDRNLDHLITGKEIEYVEENQDSLLGKVNEKLGRVAHIWKRKESEIVEEKKLIEELISDISHQTKTPLANQKIYLEILGQEPMSETAREFLGNLGEQTDKLDFLMQSMVKTSRLETGTIRIQKQDHDLPGTLQKAIQAVVPLASKKGIELYVEGVKDFQLRHDQKWTEEAIFNLLDNAVKYTGAGGTIRINVVRQEIFARISIKDTGRGIPVERQAQIFTRFYREPEVHNQEGIGIGLYLARKIIELQDGYIEVRSEVGKGSDFQVYLPNA